MYFNEKWCIPRYVKEKCCIKDIELLAVSVRPNHNIFVLTVYILSLADAMAACEDIHNFVSQLQLAHPHSLFIISGDFNHTTLSTTVHNPSMLIATQDKTEL